MSVAIRKRSWEEHVTQQTGQPFNSDEYDIACHHGLASDSLQASMEKDATLNAGHKEKCASLPDCCCGPEPRDFPGRPMGHISQEVDESGSQEGEERFLSLEASTETLVHISDEDTDSELHLTHDAQISTPQRHDRDSQLGVEGAGSLMKTLSTMHSNPDSHNSWRKAGKADVSPAEESGGRQGADAVTKSLELCKDRSSNETKDVPKVSTFDSLNVEDTTPETQLLNSAVVAKQRRKPDFPKEEQEKNRPGVVEVEFLAAPYADRGLPLLKADCGSCLLQPPSCARGMSAENDPERSGLSEDQNKIPLKVNTEDGLQCLHLRGPVTTQETIDNQVRLRKRKETRDDRDRTRLDSMVLLIMKLDQLDQDIENALSTASSASSTPTNLRRHVPDLESGSESRADSISINQTQVTLSSNPDSTDSSSTPGSNSGTKPKAMVSCKKIPEQQSVLLNMREALIACCSVWKGDYWSLSCINLILFMKHHPKKMYPVYFFNGYITSSLK
ncbi:rho GTPase-activating protein 7 isoform X3 [Cricetulus griseus]|uniref:Rho GTPase-activating protein 7 isoform X3 n=1 Tax=Cricetulus griseus TaxID=10029 RepID=A0A9J7EZ44_CRIGR|nr:rho GTPase-activating protein 7 isoform X3 [Cricetulus griseus]XP_027247034.1 rho GTPase-activating protein 7 isoform X3 [Cricetulus griseus]